MEHELNLTRLDELARMLGYMSLNAFIEAKGPMGNIAEIHDENLKELDRLITKLSSLRRNKVRQDEKYWVYRFIRANLLWHGTDNSEWAEKAEFLNSPIMEDFKFMQLYVISDYATDPLGRKPHFDFLLIGQPQPFFSDVENLENTVFLRKIASEWESIVEKENHSDPRLKMVSEETRRRLKEELELHKNYDRISEEGLEEFKLKLFLLYKYIYLRGLEIFSDSVFHDLHLNGTVVAFDFDSYVHLGRHLAKVLRDAPVEKTYFKEVFGLNTHESLKEIFDNISLHKKAELILLRPDRTTQLFFEINEIVYSVWIEPIKNKSPKEVQFKLKSIYPAEDAKEVEKYNLLEKTPIHGNLYFYF